MDSLSLDHHKTLFQPMGLGMLLSRKVGDGTDQGQVCSQKHLLSGSAGTLRAFTIWFSVARLGLDVFRSSLEEKLQLANYYSCKLKEVPGLVVEGNPVLAIVNFRVQGHNIEDSNARTKALSAKLQAKGHFHLDYTTLCKYYCIRICVCNFRFHLTKLCRLIDLIRCSVSSSKRYH